MLRSPITAALASSVVSALGLTSGTTTLLENRGPSRKGEVRANTSIWPAKCPCLRSLAAALVVNSLIASLKSVKAVMGCPKLRVQAICFFGAIDSDSSMHGSPRSSRHVRSSTTPTFP